MNTDTGMRIGEWDNYFEWIRQIAKNAMIVRLFTKNTVYCILGIISIVNGFCPMFINKNKYWEGTIIKVNKWRFYFENPKVAKYLDI